MLETQFKPSYTTSTNPIFVSDTAPCLDWTYISWPNANVSWYVEENVPNVKPWVVHLRHADKKYYHSAQCRRYVFKGKRVKPYLNKMISVTDTFKRQGRGG